jgi:hypothetical protein
MTKASPVISSFEKTDSESSWNVIKSTFGLIGDRRMMYLNLQLIHTGVSNAFWISFLVAIQIDGQQGSDITYERKQSLAEWGMVVFGLG